MTYGHISTLEDIILLLCRMHGNILMKLAKITHHWSRGASGQGHAFKGQGDNSYTLCFKNKHGAELLQ